MGSVSRTIEFVVRAEVDSAALAVELDSELHLELYGEERSQFAYGETCFFRVFAWPATLAVTVQASDGVLESMPALGVVRTGVAEIDEDVFFAWAREATLSKPALQVLGWEWLGADLGALSVDGSRVACTRDGVGVARVTYRAAWTRYGITLPERDAETWPVLVGIRGS